MERERHHDDYNNDNVHSHVSQNDNDHYDDDYDDNDVYPAHTHTQKHMETLTQPHKDLHTLKRTMFIIGMMMIMTKLIILMIMMLIIMIQIASKACLRHDFSEHHFHGSFDLSSPFQGLFFSFSSHFHSPFF